MIRYLDRGGLAVEINGSEYEMTDIISVADREDGWYEISGLINGQRFMIGANATKKYFPDEDFGEWASEIEGIELHATSFHDKDWAEGVAWLHDHIEFLVNGEEPDFNNGD